MYGRNGMVNVHSHWLLGFLLSEIIEAPYKGKCFLRILAIYNKKLK